MKRITILIVATLLACGGANDADEPYDWSDPANPPEAYDSPYSVDCHFEGSEGYDDEALYDAYANAEPARDHDPLCIRAVDGFGGTISYCSGQETPDNPYYNECRFGSFGDLACRWEVIAWLDDGACQYDVACVPEARWEEVSWQTWDENTC